MSALRSASRIRIIRVVGVTCIVRRKTARGIGAPHRGTDAAQFSGDRDLTPAAGIFTNLAVPRACQYSQAPVASGLIIINLSPGRGFVLRGCTCANSASL